MIILTEILTDVLMEKKLCPKGRAYYDRRRAAGEKPSAYLSGRAVKVCKGLMEGDEETVECENCGWEWNLEDGGKDPFICHKCGHDNVEKYDINESLHDWFKKEDWVRIDTAGNITGPCGTMKKGNKTTRCLPRAKANSLTKAERAATSKKKAASDKQFVPNTKKAKVKLRESNSQIKSELKDVLGEVDEYDVDNEQDIKEFVQFMLEYKETLSESEYQGRKVQLGKPMRGDIKKFKVYVKNPAGNVVKVNFGHGGTSAASKGEKTMRIRKSNPTRRKSFRARHNCDTPGPRTKARYWSCRKW